MINFEHVSFSYDNTPVIDDLSFALPAKGVFRFAGPSGCGKTTLLRLIAGMEVPRAGVITRQPNSIVSMVFQENRLLPWLTAEENISFVCNDLSRVENALKTVSLWEDCHKYPKELSGGMQRRVAIARAIAYGGDILILDEPFTGLDEHRSQDIAEAICREFSEKLILLVTHSEEEAALFSAKTLVLPSPLTGSLL